MRPLSNGRSAQRPPITAVREGRPTPRNGAASGQVGRGARTAAHDYARQHRVPLPEAGDGKLDLAWSGPVGPNGPEAGSVLIDEVKVTGYARQLEDNRTLDQVRRYLDYGAETCGDAGCSWPTRGTGQGPQEAQVAAGSGTAFRAAHRGRQDRGGGCPQGPGEVRAQKQPPRRDRPTSPCCPWTSPRSRTSSTACAGERAPRVSGDTSAGR